MKRLLSIRTLALLAVPAVAACESLIGADFGDVAHGPPPSGTGGSSNQSPEAGADSASPACSNLAPPPRHSGTASPDDAVEFTVVLRDIDFGDYPSEAGVPAFEFRGFDLDGVCTSPGRSSCTPPAWIGSVAPDGPRGQDNGIGRLMLDQLTAFGLQAVGTKPTNDAVAQGLDAPMGLLRIRGYGGLSTDERLEVDWFVAARPDGGADAGGPPAFDATDHFPILSNTVKVPSAASAADTVSLYRDDAAYVERNRLVAHFDEVLVPLKNTHLSIRDVIVTGEPVRDPRTRTWTLTNGQFGGHAHADDLLQVIPAIAVDAFAVKLCPSDTANYPGVKRVICASADMPSGSGTSCTESSLGFTFGTATSNTGALVPPKALQILCPDLTTPDSCSVAPASD